MPNKEATILSNYSKIPCPRCGDNDPVSPYAGNYPSLRKSVFDRTGGVCAFCGCRPATDTHHWAVEYPCGDCCTEADLIPLCSACHSLATHLRRFEKSGGSVFQFVSLFKKVISKCSIKSSLKGKARLSTTAVSQDSTQEVQSLLRSQRSQKRKAPTEQRSMTCDFVNSNATNRFGSTRWERLQSQSE